MRKSATVGISAQIMLATCVAASQGAAYAAEINSTPPVITAFGSDQFAPNTTAHVNSGSFTVVTDARGSLVRSWLDGRRLRDRTMRVEGAEASTQLPVDVTTGSHSLKIEVVADDGASTTGVTTFAAVAPAMPRLGRVVGPTGDPIAGAAVEFHVTDSSDATWSTLLDTETSDANGYYMIPDSFTGSLAESFAADNDGVLSVQAVVSADAFVNGTTVPMLGVSSYNAKVAIAPTGGTKSFTAAGSQASSDPVPDVQLWPTDDSISASVSRSQTAPVGPLAALVGSTQSTVASPSFSPSAAKKYGRNPLSSWKNASFKFSRVATKRSIAVAPTASGDQDGCYYSSQSVKILVSTNIAYTKVLEGHSGQDSKATVSYTSTAGSAVSQGISYNQGRTWKVGGNTYVGNSFNMSSGYVGARSYEWKVPILYKKYEYWHCGLVGGHYKKTRYQETEVDASKVQIPNGGYTGEYGANVSASDGYYGWKDAPYRAHLDNGTWVTVDSSKFKKYTAAVSVFGFEVSSETNLSSTRLQRLDAGNAGIDHWAFAWEPFDGTMKVFYAY